jgi:hypothetical protein
MEIPEMHNGIVIPKSRPKIHNLFLPRDYSCDINPQE